MTPPMTLEPGLPYPIGATLRAHHGVEGVNFAVVSEHAQAVEMGRDLVA